MKISIITQEKSYDEMLIENKIHLILPATESLGFGGTRYYLRFKCKMDDYTIERFIDQVNDKNEVGSLYPRFNISVFPTEKKDFNQYIKDVFELETKYIKSQYMVFDFFANSFCDEEVKQFIDEIKNQISSENTNYKDIKIEVRNHSKFSY